MAFRDGRLTLAIPFEDELFEPKITRSLLDYRTVARYHGVIALAVGLVEDLGLNTRIWCNREGLVHECAGQLTYNHTANERLAAAMPWGVPLN